MNTNITPEPWFAVEYAGTFDIQAKDEYGSPSLFDRDECYHAEQNAKLAAAAPELLEACQRALEVLESENIFGQARLLLVVAIKKAIG